MSERYLEDFAVDQVFGSGRVVVDTARAKVFATEFDPQPNLDRNELTMLSGVDTEDYRLRCARSAGSRLPRHS